MRLDFWKVNPIIVNWNNKFIIFSYSREINYFMKCFGWWIDLLTSMIKFVFNSKSENQHISVPNSSLNIPKFVLNCGIVHIH